MTLREAVNIVAYLTFMLGLLGVFPLLWDVRHHQSISYMEAGYVVTCCLPWCFALVTGQSYSMAFFSGLFWGGQGSARHHYSKERAWARAGRGQEVAHAYLWRDRLFGDTPGLIAVMELGQLDPNMKPEIVRAAGRLLSRGLSKADKDHVGRLFQLAKVSEVRQSYPGSR